ncbi:MAG: helix-turn-helix transcriptional regulator [Gemmataceae bacterium]
MATKTNERFYLLGSEPTRRFRFPAPVEKLRRRSQFHAAIRQAPKQDSVWIATQSVPTEELLKEAFGGSSKTSIRPRLGRLLLLFPPSLEILPALEELFAPIAWGTASFKLLPYEELAEVLAAKNRDDLFIGGFADRKTDTLILYRGNFDRLAVPTSIFKSPGTAAKPNPSALALTDYGQTVCLGEYEAASDAILYEVDPEFRRRLNAKRREEDRSFGACLRRLRIQKGLRQSDFNSIPAKTIARIERGEVGKPHRDTLQKIANCLNVDPQEIETF